MKNHCSLVSCALLVVVFLLGVTPPAKAQDWPTYGGPSAGVFSFDGGMRQLRFNAMSGFSSRYDDYLRCAPGIFLLGMKTFGCESKTSWGRMLVSDAFSAAIMVGLVNGIKYSVRRPRPDGSTRNSFPSGHTATAFMLAAMFHEEYGWRSPWLSFGAYTAATATAVGRIMNDRHWASDLVGGAIIGIVATRLGYLITDKIFGDKYLNAGYSDPGFSYDPALGHCEAAVYFGYRLFPGWDKKRAEIPRAGSSIGFQVNVPFLAGLGVCARAGANSLTFDSGRSFNMYNVAAGGFWQWPFAKIFELETRIMLGYAWHRERSGVDLLAGPALSVVAGNNFKIKAFAEYEAFSLSSAKSLAHSVQTGIVAAFFW